VSSSRRDHFKTTQMMIVPIILEFPPRAVPKKKKQVKNRRVHPIIKKLF